MQSLQSSTPNPSLFQVIMTQLPVHKICQLQENRRLQWYFETMVNKEAQCNRTPEEIADIIKKELQLLEGEETWNSTHLE